ncbi:MAG: hypothetical protein WBD07_15690 [Vicinamibacterales bacterium]
MGVMNEHYAAVLADLRTRKQGLESELAVLEAGIQSILKVMGHGESVSENANPVPAGIKAKAALSPSRFANISVRWGVLWHLAEDATGSEKTGEIAENLKAGGYKTDAANFSNMVSGVLSLMKSKQEVAPSEDGGYVITDEGRRTWQLIRQGAKFREATHANGPSLLSVQ